MNEIRVWVDGDLVDPAEPSIRALDHGITVGDGAFETCKVVDGEPFAMARHLRRLDRSMSGLGLSTPDHHRIREGARAVLSAGNPIALGRLRYTVTGGLGPLGSYRIASPLTHIVTADTIPPPPVSCTIATVPWVRNERAATAGLKTTSYAENVIALARAHQFGADEGILANTRGELCEGTGSNIFVVVDGVIRTPPLDSGCLAGITRELTIEWCHEHDLEVREEPLPLDILTRCVEVFLTSSTKGVMPIERIDARGLEVPGPMTVRAREIYVSTAHARPDP